MFLFGLFQVTNQNDTEANSDPIGTVYISIEGKQATNAFSLVTAEGDVTEPKATQPEAKPGNGGSATTTVSFR